MENQHFTDSECSQNERKHCGCCHCCSFSNLLLTILVLSLIIWLFCPKQYQYNGTKIVFTFDKEDFLPQYLAKNVH